MFIYLLSGTRCGFGVSGDFGVRTKSIGRSATAFFASESRAYRKDVCVERINKTRLHLTSGCCPGPRRARSVVVVVGPVARCLCCSCCGCGHCGSDELTIVVVIFVIAVLSSCSLS